MQQKKTDTENNVRPKTKGGFLSLTEQERDKLLERNRTAREDERKEFIAAYFASDMRYNIK